MKKTPAKKLAPANCNALLEKELTKVRAVCDKLPNGRTLLADFLRIRLSEVSRYLAKPAGRKPSGPVLVGMLAFVRIHNRQARPPRIVCTHFVDDRPSEMHCEACDATKALPLFFTQSGLRNAEYEKIVSAFIAKHRKHASIGGPK